MTVASVGGGLDSAAPAPLGAAHRRRLREVWRSAGWPCHDAIELDLLAAALLSRHWDAEGRETLRVTDAGIQMLAAARRRNQAAFDAHETLVARVALEMQRAGRIVWRGLSLRAPLPRDDGGTTWAMAMPDVYSIRHTTLEDQVEPIAHEIKVSRADLLADLRRQAKAAAYLAVASQCWYVLREGIASADEVPAAYGVIFAGANGLDVARAAPRRAQRLSLPVWMALARAAAERHDVGDDAQEMLGASASPPG
ncbi:MAG: hypothetical protein Q7U73_02255 [Rubrivivax sp.]|nr:hypothetical protein [Rubrivivax sp.]